MDLIHKLHIKQSNNKGLLTVTIISLSILFLIISSAGYCYAESYSFNDCVSFDPGDGFTVYTDPEGTSDREGYPEEYALLAESDTLGYYWYFYFINGNYSIDFATLSDEDIGQLVTNDSTGLAADDISYEIYDNGQKYLVFDSYSKETDGDILFYVTGVGNSLYYFVASTDDGQLNDAQKEDLRKVIDGVTYVRQEAPTEESERRAALFRVLRRFAFAIAALVLCAVVVNVLDKLKSRFASRHDD